MTENKHYIDRPFVRTCSRGERARMNKQQLDYAYDALENGHRETVDNLSKRITELMNREETNSVLKHISSGQSFTWLLSFIQIVLLLVVIKAL